MHGPETVQEEPMFSEFENEEQKKQEQLDLKAEIGRLIEEYRKELNPSGGYDTNSAPGPAREDIETALQKIEDEKFVEETKAKLEELAEKKD